jgi:hypothetical protein
MRTRSQFNTRLSSPGLTLCLSRQYAHVTLLGNQNSYNECWERRASCCLPSVCAAKSATLALAGRCREPCAAVFLLPFFPCSNWGSLGSFRHSVTGYPKRMSFTCAPVQGSAGPMPTSPGAPQRRPSFPLSRLPDGRTDGQQRVPTARAHPPGSSLHQLCPHFCSTATTQRGTR